MRPCFQRYSVIFFLLVLGGCTATPSTHITSPLTARPLDLYKTIPPDTGGIYQVGYGQHPLFEDVRARNLGDTIQILLQESSNATEADGNSLIHAGSITSTTPAIVGAVTGQHVLDGITSNSSSSNKLTNTNNNNGNNFLSGSITATVIEVLPNGNLKVSGEKLVTVNQTDQYIRISGVINPVYVQYNNTIPSTQVADAQIEYRGGNTNIDSAAIKSMLGHFFLSSVPF